MSIRRCGNTFTLPYLSTMARSIFALTSKLLKFILVDILAFINFI